MTLRTVTMDFDPSLIAQYNNDGRPNAPDYKPSYDRLSMGMQPGLDAQLAALNTDRRGINKYREEALRSGPSTWAQLASAQQDELARQARGQAVAENMGQMAGARSQLAMRGGINSGARERIATSGMRNAMDASQNALRQANANKMQIGINDEQNRMNQLQALPGMENTAVQPDLDRIKLWGQGRQFDVQNQIGETDKENLFNMNRYQQQMQAWAANKQANATENSGKK